MGDPVRKARESARRRADQCALPKPMSAFRSLPVQASRASAARPVQGLDRASAARSRILSPIAVPGQQRVFVVNVRVSVKADGGHVVCAAHGFFVQRLNVFEQMFEAQIACVEFVRRQAVKHECVVGIW
jgi:hypothetical protein